MDAIEVLSPSLFEEQSQYLKIIDHWLAVLNWANGWHYDLDLLWLFKHIERLQLKKGATIVDAGAGLGVNQFILASMGFNVISLDFAYRQIPQLAKDIFRIKTNQDAFEAPKNEYMEFMTYAPKKTGARPLWTAKKLLGALRKPGKVSYILQNKLRSRFNLANFFETRKDHKDFGEITLLRGSFNNIPLPDQSVDLLVSVSAFEHNQYADMPASVGEFSRVVKKGAYLLVTTSLAKETDWYFEPSKGWNLTATSLKKWFQIEQDSVCEFDRTLAEISQSQTLKARLSPFYKYNANNGLPYGHLQEAKYVPCGIIKCVS